MAANSQSSTIRYKKAFLHDVVFQVGVVSEPALAVSIALVTHIRPRGGGTIEVISFQSSEQKNNGKREASFRRVCRNSDPLVKSGLLTNSMILKNHFEHLKVLRPWRTLTPKIVIAYGHCISDSMK